MAAERPPDERPLKKRRREATLYDAVAGRVQTRGFLPSVAYTSSTRDTAVVSTQPVRPEEVLFRRKHAPQRYEEDDIYFQDRFLPEEGKELPASDFLKALHSYASSFYGGLEKIGFHCGGDWTSLDETALLAMGVLLEEQCKHELGATGHLAMLEEDHGEEAAGDLVWNGRAWVQSALGRHPHNRRDTSGEADPSDGEPEETESGSDSDEESDGTEAEHATTARPDRPDATRASPGVESAGKSDTDRGTHSSEGSDSSETGIESEDG